MILILKKWMLCLVAVAIICNLHSWHSEVLNALRLQTPQFSSFIIGQKLDMGNIARIAQKLKFNKNKDIPKKDKQHSGGERDRGGLW